MAYIALQPCRVAGVDYRVGDKIEGGVFVENRAAQLEAMQIIARDGESAPIQVAVSSVPIVLHAEDGDFTISVSHGGIQAVVDALTSTLSDAEPVIEAMTENDALILLHATDSRKGVKDAAASRAKALEEAGEH